MHGQVRKLILVAAMAAAAFGCTKKDAEPEAGATAKQHPRGGANAFSVEASAPAEVAVGDKGELVVTVTAKSTFHVNAEYPHNFRPDESPALKYESKRYALADIAEKTPCEATPEDTCVMKARIPFTAEAAGTHKASGVVAFSVCDPEVCLIEKVPVFAEVVAK